MTCLGVLERGERGDGNGTGLKERGGIEMSTTVPPLNVNYSASAPLVSLGYLDEETIAQTLTGTTFTASSPCLRFGSEFSLQLQATEKPSGTVCWPLQTLPSLLKTTKKSSTAV